MVDESKGTDTNQEETQPNEAHLSDDKPKVEYQTVEMRNNFYRDSFTRLLIVLLLSIGLSVTLGVVLFYKVSNPPRAKYFATSINGRITPLSPLDMPNQSDSAVLQWANEAAIAAYTYNFVNYRNELRQAATYFTRTGWGQFLTALQDSGALDTVKRKKLVVSAVATDAPIILRKGILNGRYSWRIQMKLNVTYQSASDFQQSGMILTILVRRISTLETARGIGISQFIVKRMGTIG